MLVSSAGDALQHAITLQQGTVRHYLRENIAKITYSNTNMMCIDDGKYGSTTTTHLM